ncbi:MAG: TonB-dependent receptor [Pseudomonadales bacterium]|nr:TonB-dependent receptor [Pseudomonadales bacterium]
MRRAYNSKILSLPVFFTLVLPGVSQAQELPDNGRENAERIDEIVVTGTASNYQNSVRGKRSADGIVDMFDTDEIGRLPDKNIGETLNRIPGVSMLLEKGEGRFVQIRGVSPRLNNITINGMQMGSGDTESGGRLAPMDMIGGELLGGVQVSKTPTSDMDGQGIGGTLNITTKQPFDYDEDFVALFAGRSGIESIDSIPVADTKQTPWSADATLVGKLMDGKLGWLGGASFSNRKTPLLGIFQDDWTPVTFDPDPAVSGDEQTVSLPINVKNNVTVVSRERLNLNGTLEFRPDDASRYYVRGFFSNWDEIQLRNRFEQGLSNNLRALDGVGTAALGGVTTGNRVQVNLRNEPTDKEMFSLALGGENVVGPWTIDYIGQHNDNRIAEPNTNWEFRSGSSTFGPDAFVIEDSGVTAVGSAGGPDPQDLSLQGFRRVRFLDQTTDSKDYIAALNIRHDLDLDFAAVDEAYLKVGGKWTRTERQTLRSQSNYGVGQVPWNLGQDPALSGGGFTNPVPVSARPNIWLDLEGLNDFFAANRDNTDFFILNEQDTFLNEFQSDFELRERVTAAYGMGKIKAGMLSLIGGVRVENTNVVSSAFTIVDDGNGLSAVPSEGSGSYTNVLPSFILTAELPHDVVIRASYAQALGRPEYDALAPRSALSLEDDPVLGSVGTLSIGNPDLKARESSNYDLSLEWYFKEGSMLALALFYKDIKNEIVPAPTQRFENFTFQGQTFTRFDINTTINAQSAEVKGIELSFVDQFSFLPGLLDGLGFAGSITLLDSEIDIERGGVVETLPLLEQADSSISTTLFYQKGPVDISATYNYNDNFLTSFGPTRALDLDQGAFGRIDFRAQYSVNDNFKVFVEGVNLSNEPTTEFQGGVALQKTEFEFTGRTYSMGFSSRF